MSAAFLDDDELERLTGYVKPSKQIEWLREHGFPFTINAKGRPVVRRDMDKTAVPEPELGRIR